MVAVLGGDFLKSTFYLYCTHFIFELPQDSLSVTFKLFILTFKRFVQFSFCAINSEAPVAFLLFNDMFYEFCGLLNVFPSFEHLNTKLAANPAYLFIESTLLSFFSHRVLFKCTFETMCLLCEAWLLNCQIYWNLYIILRLLNQTVGVLQVYLVHNLIPKLIYQLVVSLATHRLQNLNSHLLNIKLDLSQRLLPIFIYLIAPQILLGSQIPQLLC